MTKAPFSSLEERFNDMLWLINTNVCSPFRFVSRNGDYYFFTFTDDYSWYGYVYLTIHKHEISETFKAYQREVENKLGKIIKALWSDHGGE